VPAIGPSTTIAITDRIGDQQVEAALVLRSQQPLVGGKRGGEQEHGDGGGQHQPLAAPQGSPKLAQIDLVFLAGGRVRLLHGGQLILLGGGWIKHGGTAGAGDQVGHLRPSSDKSSCD
jgi:hypothetical protein